MTIWTKYISTINTKSDIDNMTRESELVEIVPKNCCYEAKQG